MPVRLATLLDDDQIQTMFVPVVVP